MKKIAKKERKMGNKYLVEMKNKNLVFTAIKTLAKNKTRTDSVKLNGKQISELKHAARVSKEKYFELCDKLIAAPAKIDSTAKKAGLTRNTGYDASHYRTAKVLSIKV